MMHMSSDPEKIARAAAEAANLAARDYLTSLRTTHPALSELLLEETADHDLFSVWPGEGPSAYCRSCGACYSCPTLSFAELGGWTWPEVIPR